jgi:hypothetical protein
MRRAPPVANSSISRAVCSASGALARRHHWARQVGNDGIVRVTVPLGQLRTVPGPNLEKPTETADFAGLGQAQALSDGTDPRTAESGPRTDPGSDPLVAQAIEALREQLGIANRRIDELQAALREERRRGDRDLDRAPAVVVAPVVQVNVGAHWLTNSVPNSLNR